MANPTTVLSRAPPADPRAAPADAGKPASLVPDERTPEPAEARLRDGRELQGMLARQKVPGTFFLEKVPGTF